MIKTEKRTDIFSHWGALLKQIQIFKASIIHFQFNHSFSFLSLFFIYLFIFSLGGGYCLKLLFVAGQLQKEGLYFPSSCILAAAKSLSKALEIGKYTVSIVCLSVCAC